MLQRVFDFGHAFAHARENGFTRIATGGQHARQFAARHDIETAAQRGEMFEQAQIAVGFNGIANQRLERGEGLSVDFKRFGERVLAVNI